MKMKTALVHDWMTSIAGAENVLASMYEVFPSPIYTLVCNQEKLKNSFFEGKDIRTSFIQNLPFSKKAYRNYLPLFPMAIEQLDLSSYDVILSSSHAVAKGVLTRSDQLHICYCHTPMRYAWDLYHDYLERENLQKGLKGKLAKMFLHYLRLWDLSSSNQVDFFVANSKYVAKRILKNYRREAAVIYPPINTEFFTLHSQKEEFYVTASRMVSYKRIDLIVEAFSKMPEKRLLVIGTGPEEKRIKSLATKNIEFLGHVDNEMMKSYLQRAKAFVFAACEDFGSLPLEAQACGTPVIAFGKGGALETVKEGKTGLFFFDQTKESIIKAVEDFEKMAQKVDPLEVRKWAESFSKKKFQENFQEYVEVAYKNFSNANF
jgi:glycosyltransferase involved in cell wall biosynthesis